MTDQHHSTTYDQQQESDVLSDGADQNRISDDVSLVREQHVTDAAAAADQLKTKSDQYDSVDADSVRVFETETEMKDEKETGLSSYPLGDGDPTKDGEKSSNEDVDNQASTEIISSQFSPNQNDDKTATATAPANFAATADTILEGSVSPSVPADTLCNGKDHDEEEDKRRLLSIAKTASPSVTSQQLSMEEEEERAEGENCRLLSNSEMDGCHQTQQPDNSVGSSRSDVGDKEERRLMQKPVERPVRTCAVLCVAFFFVYTANLAIQNLQSSLHQAAGLGITSLAVLYGSIIVFGTLSPLVIRFLNAKRTLVLAFVCHLLYTLSNFYSTFPTLLTSSLLLGAMAGPMWTAQGLYCTATGLAYAGIKQIETHGALSLFNGVFFAFYEATQISGNLIASAVLMRSSYNDTEMVSNKVCGAAVCPDTEMNSTKIEQPEQYIVYILMSIYLGCNIAGLLLTVFALPPLPRDQEIQAGQSSLKKSTTSCLSMLLVPKMILLLPFFMAQAMNSGILLAEYSQKFVSCVAGIQWVGYVMTVFGVLTAAQAVGLNYAAKILGRRLLFTAAAVADLSVNVTMLLWDPTGASVPSLFILPCVSGFAEGIFQAQFNSLVAMVFPEKVTAAFATYHTSKATAFTLTFVLARFLCLNQRLYVSLALSTLGLLGYCTVEVMLHRKKQRQAAEAGNDRRTVNQICQENKHT